MLKFKGPKAKPTLTKVPVGGIPLAPMQGHVQECAVATLFKNGNCVLGAIIFSGRSEKFEYIPMRGEVSPLLEDQCPILLSRDKDLGNARLDPFSLRYEEDGETYECRLFLRVLYGKTSTRPRGWTSAAITERLIFNYDNLCVFSISATKPVQVMASLAYLNRSLRKATSLTDKLAKYNDLIDTVRDFLHPSYKLMTRTSHKAGYKWVKMTKANEVAIVEEVSLLSFLFWDLW